MNDAEKNAAEDVIRELVAPLRNVTVRAEVRKANRAAIRRMLHSRSQAWWRRKVTVPLPLAIAAILAIVAITIGLLLPRRVDFPGPAEQDGAAPPPIVWTSLTPRFTAGETAVGVWTVSRSYIQSFDALANTRANASGDTKEQGDAS